MTQQVAVLPIDSALPPELRRCEDLFFDLDFSELARVSTQLIAIDAAAGDGYAYRSFAHLGVSQHSVGDRDDVELVELLRDYFHACERPMASEGAAVCRLLLKLVFAELVRRISNARPGEKFALQKSDPLCGGAFAILEGDFERARRSFGTAVLDPESRAYAYAGIGLLKAIHSDLPDALRAFSDAGPVDEDVRALIASLQPAAVATVHA
ncbi:MAG TPA: hypothetical protein VLZ50_07890 [Terracidiphilus sp.]|nr:hypothetical protein [Terracidiphilus sp.]